MNAFSVRIRLFFGQLAQVQNNMPAALLLERIRAVEGAQ
jgi:hypothetical protein